jgi:hypothetical protein
MSNPTQQMLLLSNVRITFPKLLAGQEESFKGTPGKAGDSKNNDPYFSAGFIIVPTDPQVAAIKAEIARVAQAKFPQNWEEMLKIFQAKDKLPIHDGMLKANKPYGAAYKGNLYVSARNNAKQGPIPVYDNVIDPKTGEPRVILSPTDPKFPYSGSYVNAYLNFFYYNQGGGEGIGGGICGVQFHADGERLAGGVTAAAGAFKAAPPPADVAQKAAASGQGAASLF